jgi:hypothetical protein
LIYFKCFLEIRELGFFSDASVFKEGSRIRDELQVVDISSLKNTSDLDTRLTS